MRISVILLETHLPASIHKEVKIRRNYVKGKKIVQRNYVKIVILFFPFFG